jgi:hypothetical protein
MIDRVGSAIEIGNSTPQHATATVAAFHDRNWWRVEARRVGSDWGGVLAVHAKVVAAWRRRHDPDYGGLAGPEASRHPGHHRNLPHGHLILAAAANGDLPAGDHRRAAVAVVEDQPSHGRAAESTVEALMFTLRAGLGALKQPNTLRRLSELNVTQLRHVMVRLQKFKPEIAPPWSPDEIAVLFAVWGKIHAPENS